MNETAKKLLTQQIDELQDAAGRRAVAEFAERHLNQARQHIGAQVVSTTAVDQALWHIQAAEVAARRLRWEIA